MAKVYCGGEGAYFDDTEFAPNDDGVVVHTGKGHTILGEPESYDDRVGPLGHSEDE